MPALLATGTTALASADFTTVGESTTLFLVSSTSDLPANCVVTIQMKAANNLYYRLGELNNSVPALVLSSPGTYRVSRPVGPNVGVDRT